MSTFPAPLSPPAAAPSPQTGIPDATWREALEQVCERPGLVRTAFQPIVDLRVGAVRGFEVLSRFPEAPTAAPNEWFSAAVRLGLAAQLEASVIQAALSRRHEVPPDCFTAINVSPWALFSPEVEAAFAGEGRLDGMAIEITEQLALDDYGRLAAVLQPLRARGLTVAIDDVGAENASLNQIIQLRPELVKIDRSVVSGVDRDSGKAAVVETLVALSVQTGARVIAEGIERAEELDALIRLRVPFGQGYAFGRPHEEMSAAEPELAPYIRERAGAAAEPQSAAALAERGTTLRANRRREEIARALIADPELQHLPILDGDGRPVNLIERESFLRGSFATSTSLRVAPVERLGDMARRAMSRPAGERLRPLVCCDAEGRFIGLIRIERLIEALAREVDAAARGASG